MSRSAGVPVIRKVTRRLAAIRPHNTREPARPVPAHLRTHQRRPVLLPHALAEGVADVQGGEGGHARQRHQQPIQAGGGVAAQRRVPNQPSHKRNGGRGCELGNGEGERNDGGGRRRRGTAPRGPQG